MTTNSRKQVKNNKKAKRHSKVTSKLKTHEEKK